MTKQARSALADCKLALADFEASESGPRGLQRSRWVALITLLRAVGHVLDKVDRPAASSDAKKRMNDAWQQLGSAQRPNIFHDFIEAERNDTVKQYEIRAARNPKIHGAWTMEGKPLYVSQQPGAATLDAFSMLDGPYKGHDPSKLAKTAIEFWQQYLDTIDGV